MKSHFKACRKIVAFLDFKHQIACSNTLLDWNTLRQFLQKSTSFLCTFQESIQIKKGLTAWKRGHEYVYKTPSKKATIPSKKSYEVLQPNIAAGSRAFLKLYLNLNCIWIYKILRYIFKLHITLLQDQKKGKSLTKSYCNEKFNTISKKCWPHCVVLESESRFPPIFFLFSCGLDSFHSLLQLSIGLRRSFFSLALQTIRTQNTYSRPLL